MFLDIKYIDNTMEALHLSRGANKRRRRSAAPIYFFILIWLLNGYWGNLFTLSGLLIAIGTSVAAGILIGSLISAARRKKEQRRAPEAEAAQPKAPEAPPAKSYGPEVDAIIADGKKAMKEMGRLYASIKNPEIRKKINELMRISDKIIQDAIQDSTDVPEIRKFLNYYLPTTIKLLNAYDRMSDIGIDGENLSKSMTSIEGMLDTAIDAFKKQLDSLFANQALDIETDISVMNRMLAREGLTGGGELDELIAKAEREQSRAKAEDKPLKSAGGSAAAVSEDAQ
jgi:hypothetical protein